MEILIDIPEDVYKRTVFYREFRDLNDCVTTIKALEKATPLPEHHGRLIDADYMIKQLLSLPKDELSTEDTWAMKVLDLAPTIIEADKGSESE